MVFFFKQKTSYEVRISDWSSDVCSSDLSLVQVSTQQIEHRPDACLAHEGHQHIDAVGRRYLGVELEADARLAGCVGQQCGVEERGRRERDILGLPIRAQGRNRPERSEEHTSELQSLMRISYAVFCFKK